MSDENKSNRSKMNPVNIRFFCTRHNKPLYNVGSGQILYPTNDPQQADQDGWWEFDMSEYSCHDWSEESDCSDDHEVQAV